MVTFKLTKFDNCLHNLDGFNNRNASSCENLGLRKSYNKIIYDKGKSYADSTNVFSY